MTTSSRCLLDKLPVPDEQGRVIIRGHWLRKDREQIAICFATLGLRLRSLQCALDGARSAKDVNAIRAGCMQALFEIEEALQPIVGAAACWPIRQAVDALEYAAHKKRHYLTALPNDELHFRRDAPARLIMMAAAAAVLDYFDGKLDLTQEQIASRIGEALGEGGFRVPGKRQPSKPSARTVQEWRARCIPGSLHRPQHANLRSMSQDIRSDIEKSRGDRSASDHFEIVLESIIDESRDRAVYLRS